MEKHETEIQNQNDIVRIEIGDWLYNAGIVGLMNIISFNNGNPLSDHIKIGDNYIEFNKSLLDGFTDKFFEFAFKFHGKYDSIYKLLKEIQSDIKSLKDNKLEVIAKKYKLNESTEKLIIEKIIQIISQRWKGVAYESFIKIKRSKFKTTEDLSELTNKLINILKENREYFVEKEVQTYLRNFSKQGSFLSLNIKEGQKEQFKKDFETPLLEGTNYIEKKYNCIYCNTRIAKKDTIFSTALVLYQGLNKDARNFTWGFKSKLPLCEICELVYFVHWAGLTKSFKNSTFLFVNDDSSIANLWKSNMLLKNVINNNHRENLLVSYFYELLLNEEKIKSNYYLQNIALVEIDIESNIMPKIMTLNISRNQAYFIKESHEILKSLSTKFFKIKDDYKNLLYEFIYLILNDKINFNFINRLLKFYLQGQEETKNFISTNYNPKEINKIVVLINNYIKNVKHKSINMEKRHIWHIYSLGNDMQKKFIERDARNKINSISYRLLNAVRANDKTTFLNVLLRLYIGFNMEAPKSLVNSLELEENFKIIGHSYVNGLLGQALNEN
ncbi:MAG: type I-B CRISPR-associated protein Cas8b1/Cst1 [Bacteroidales bacterium]|nr:type I-B CRISPR-associated protein Cas8b1/Cst1 [Bacteroidales bacterium]MCF8337679.1 type I-B CRISPR-associated protein Cas8b1/Cst1 [Bacteroidales bacterium]